MIKTIEDINAALDGIAAAMIDKGIKSPTPKISLNQGGRLDGWLNASSRIGAKNCVLIQGDDATTILADMLAHVVALKSKEEEAVATWQKDVAKVIDDGHDLNLPDNVMAPLRASSQAMTENLLEVAK
jgi:hypothetical protein